MNCPKCKGDNIISEGSRWMCKNCCKAFPKHLRRIEVPLKDRPKCPECGAINPYSQARDRTGERRWICRACGRSYSERTAQLVLNEIPNLEVQTE
jgi:transposase-like protein